VKAGRDTEGIVAEFGRRYPKEYDFYDQAARLTAQVLEQDLQRAGIRAIVTSRAKSLARAVDKASQRAAKKGYTSVNDVYQDIVDLAAKYQAITYVDDAHGDGVLGENGRGIANHFHLEGKVDVDMGTFSKAFGCVGGYVVGSKDLCTYLQNKVRTYLLSGSQPPAIPGACIAAIQLVKKNPSLVKKLWDNTRYFKKALKDLGFDTGQSETPITPVMVGESGKAHKLADEMFKLGVFVLPIVFPMVGKDKARIRTIVTSAHTKKDLDQAADAFEKAGMKLSLI